MGGRDLDERTAEVPEPTRVEPGDRAPVFTLRDQSGEEVSLEDFSDRTVVLFFYPKADTPGCTVQACGIRDHHREYDIRDAVVLGVSPDPVADLTAFDDKFDLGFTLLSDKNHSVAEAYGVWVEKSNDGRRWRGNERTTFVIDPGGVVRDVLRRVDPARHDALVLDLIARA
jgi:peroxiredoxin Q/BCP